MRGTRCDVWLATDHRSTEDYGDYVEVAVKSLHPIKDDHAKVILEKLDDIIHKCQGSEGVRLLHGTSFVSGKMRIVS